MTDLLTASLEKLRAAGCDSPQREAQLLWEHAAGDEAKFQQLLSRRCAREPMSQILGTRGFWEHDFIVTRDVLTPRPDSEVLIEEAIKALPDKQKPYKFLDLGVGSGCLLLSLLHEFSQSTGLGIDASSAALEIANQNARTLGFKKRVKFQAGNWAEGLTEGFDLVISNPPYIPQAQIEGLMPEVRDHEPIMALVGGEDGLQFYREIITQLSALQDTGSWLIFEVGQGQAADVATIATASGFTLQKIRKDYGGIDRAVILRKS